MRSNRLTRRPEFLAVYAQGRRFFSRYFVVFALRRPCEGAFAVDEWRMGLAVTRKTGNAVRRNRVKRVVREFFRLHGGILPHDMDIVVIPSRRLDPTRLSLPMAEQELLPVLRQAVKQESGKGQP